jgi:hypothetical protein
MYCKEALMHSAVALEVVTLGDIRTGAGDQPQQRPHRFADPVSDVAAPTKSAGKSAAENGIVTALFNRSRLFME